MTDVTLYQFRYSHFNEKARWALDYKGVAHRRVSVLPGVHRGTMKKLSGRTTTPVLVIDGKVVSNSARIIEALEQRWPTPALYPADPAQRARALKLEEGFDRSVGPAVRIALYAEILREGWFLSGLFAESQPRAARLPYRLAFPLVARLIRIGYRVDDATVIANAIATCRNALDFVAREAGPEGYLVGNAFSVADLACAALLAPLVNPDHPDMHWPEPYPQRVRDFLGHWARHPGAEWVRRCYQHRSGSSVPVFTSGTPTPARQQHPGN